MVSSAAAIMSPKCPVRTLVQQWEERKSKDCFCYFLSLNQDSLQAALLLNLNETNY